MPPPPTREAWVEGLVRKWAKANGWLVFKFSSLSQRGVPDRLFIKDGLIVFIEFKGPGKKPTPLQAATIAKMKRFGAHVGVFDDPDAAIAWLQELEALPC